MESDEFGWVWRWNRTGYSIRAENGMFGCVVALDAGQMSDREATGLLSRWVASKGYREPQDPTAGQGMMLYLVNQGAQSWSLGLYRNVAGQLRVNLSPG